LKLEKRRWTLGWVTSMTVASLCVATA